MNKEFFSRYVTYRDGLLYWNTDCWKAVEKVGGEYVNNIELHHCQAFNAAYGGMAIEDIPAKVFGFGKTDTLADVFKAVVAQSYEDAELRTFG